MSNDFSDLITAYVWTARDKGRQADIANGIWRKYGVRKAALVVDLSGFSKRAATKDGLLEFLGVVRRMQTAARPIVVMHGGEIVKMEADNCFAVFDRAEEAALAAFELIDASHAIVEFEAMDLRVCCGLEIGEILLLPDHDFFGNAVNVASRLGEDLAKPDEVLVGRDIRAALESAGWNAGDISRPKLPTGAGKLMRHPSARRRVGLKRP